MSSEVPVYMEVFELHLGHQHKGSDCRQIRLEFSARNLSFEMQIQAEELLLTNIRIQYSQNLSNHEINNEKNGLNSEPNLSRCNCSTVSAI